MAIAGLSIIGESINDSIPSTNKLYAENNITGILELAKSQDAGGAAYIDVNVGRRTPEFMAEMVGKVQTVTTKPLSIDTPDIALARAGLIACDVSRGGGSLPILNSISPLRAKMFEIYGERPFKPLLLVSERVEGSAFKPNMTAEETFQTAKEMMAAAKAVGISNDQMIFDPGIGPIGSDMEGMLKRVLGTIKLIHADPGFKGVHMSVGLSNFTHMLPPKRADGSPVRSALESAFLSMAVPHGLDMIIGSVKRKYEILPADHPAMKCLAEALTLDDIEVVECVQRFYTD